MWNYTYVAVELPDEFWNLRNQVYLQRINNIILQITYCHGSITAANIVIMLYLSYLSFRKECYQEVVHGFSFPVHF